MSSPREAEFLVLQTEDLTDRPGATRFDEPAHQEQQLFEMFAPQETYTIDPKDQ